jgi:hypothetical protein
MGFIQKREIKFRDFDFDTKKVRFFNLDNYDKNEHDSYGNITEFTGFKDKNGVEIYEGDIDNKNRVCEYFPKLGSFGFKNPKHAPITFLGQFINSGNFIIGNIYENTELL